MKKCKNQSNILINQNIRRKRALQIEKDSNNVYYFYKLRRKIIK